MWRQCDSNSMGNMNELALKDENSQRPVASAWRPTLRSIVKAFALKDYALIGSKIQCVDPVPDPKARRIEKYIAIYGESLAELPDDTWQSSVSQWMGTHWEVLVDLFTEESGESDLVLFVRVFEEAGGYRYEVDSVHVP